MNCSLCRQPMVQDGESITTYNTTRKRGSHDEYERSHYVCQACDVWVGIELPREKSVTAARTERN